MGGLPNLLFQVTKLEIIRPCHLFYITNKVTIQKVVTPLQYRYPTHKGRVSIISYLYYSLQERQPEPWRQLELWATAGATGDSQGCQRQPELQETARAARDSRSCRRQPELQETARAARDSRSCKETARAARDSRGCQRQPVLPETAGAARDSQSCRRQLEFSRDSRNCKLTAGTRDSLQAQHIS